MAIWRAFAAAALLAAAPAGGQPPSGPAAAPVQAGEADRLIRSFFERLQASRPGDAVDLLFNQSAVWRSKTAERASVLAQIDAVVQGYGPVRSHELVATYELGTMFVQRRYLVQHDTMVTRWQFDLVRGAKGWSVAYFGFDDQARNWGPSLPPGPVG